MISPRKDGKRGCLSGPQQSSTNALTDADPTSMMFQTQLVQFFNNLFICKCRVMYKPKRGLQKR